MPGIQTFPCTPLFLIVTSNSDLKQCVGKFSKDKTNILRQIRTISIDLQGQIKYYTLGLSLQFPQSFC